MLDARPIRCPWCGEAFEVVVDGSAGSSRYVEDCPVCCRPISIAIDVDDGGNVRAISTARDD